MQIAQVRYFVESARLLNFTRAAAACDVSQPALSRGIKALEKEFGGALLHRAPTVAVTDLGRRLLPFLQQIDSASRAAYALATGVTSGVLVPVAIGVDGSVSPGILASWMNDLQRLFIGLSLRLESGEPDPLRGKLMSAELDLLICGHHGGTDNGPLHRVCLAREDCVVLHPVGHAFAGAGPIQATRLLTAPDRIRFCETAEILLREQGPLAPPRHQASNVDHFVQLVDAGLGWGLLPAGHPLATGRHTRGVSNPPIQRVVELVYVAGRIHTPGVAGLIRMAKTQEAQQRKASA